MRFETKDYEAKMKKTIAAYTDNLSTIRAGRANPTVLDRIFVDYYGAMTPINQMATISVAEARILVVQPWDKTALKSIEKAIQASELGINPQNDGTALRLVFPQLTEERRKELVKDVKKIGENTKVAIRSIRRDFIDKFKAMEKNNEITEDDLKNCEKDVQNTTDKFVKNIDDEVAAKEKEILSI